MRLYTLFVLACLPLLGACQFLGQQDERLAPQRITWEQHAEGCEGERCSLVNVDTLKFDDEPVLERLIEQSLLAMTREDAASPLPSSLREYSRLQLQRAPQRQETWLQAKLIDQHDDLLVIELSSYLYRGGAHGMPGRGFINYSRSQQRALQLADLLRPGQEAAFWQAASEAHQRWFKAQQIDDREEFRRIWPFQPTSNIALLGNKVLLKYDVYALGPYVMGHPSLEIPYSRLQQILREEYLPEDAR
jgi:hypothetical protein